MDAPSSSRTMLDTTEMSFFTGNLPFNCVGFCSYSERQLSKKRTRCIGVFFSDSKFTLLGAFRTCNRASRSEQKRKRWDISGGGVVYAGVSGSPSPWANARTRALTVEGRRGCLV